MGKKFKDKISGFVDKLVSKNYDDEYEYEDEYERDEYDDSVNDYKAFEFDNIKSKTDFQIPSSSESTPRYKPQYTASTSSTSEVIVKKFQPKSLEDWRTICDEIKIGKIILLDFEGIQRDLVVRISDAIFGACYMNNTKVNYFKESILIISPSYVQIEGGYVKEEIDRQLGDINHDMKYDYDNIGN